MDSPTKEREAGMPTCSTIIRSKNGRTCHMYYASVFTRPIERIPNSKVLRSHSFAIICQRHYVFYRCAVEEARNLSTL